MAPSVKTKSLSVLPSRVSTQCGGQHIRGSVVCEETLLGGHMGMPANGNWTVDLPIFCSNWAVNRNLFPPGSSWDGNCCLTPAA